MQSRINSWPRVLLIGKNGQVGRALCELLLRTTQLFVPARQILDLCEPDSLRFCIRAITPDVIINAAGYTAVDNAEIEPELAYATNASGPGILAREARKLNALLIHYSSDYVFDGNKTGRYVEADAANPVNVYGYTKVEGEKAIANSGCDFLILRTGWVYSTHGRNILTTTILRDGDQQQEVKIAADRIGAPTPAGTLASATLTVIDTLLSGRSKGISSGIYHFSCLGVASLFDFARVVCETLSERDQRGGQRILPILSRECAHLARRPLNSQLDCSKFQSTFRIRIKPWEKELAGVLASFSRKEERIVFPSLV